MNFREWDFFFFLAFLLGLYAIHRLAMVKETGEIEEKIFVRELISEIRLSLRSFSTVGGLRHMLYLPIWLIKVPLKKKKHQDNNNISLRNINFNQIFQHLI